MSNLIASKFTLLKHPSHRICCPSNIKWSLFTQTHHTGALLLLSWPTFSSFILLCFMLNWNIDPLLTVIITFKPVACLPFSRIPLYCFALFYFAYACIALLPYFWNCVCINIWFLFHNMYGMSIALDKFYREIMMDYVSMLDILMMFVCLIYSIISVLWGWLYFCLLLII